MQVKCAWCGKDLGTKDGPKDQVSHGMCVSCKDIILKEGSKIWKTPERGYHHGPQKDH